MSVYIVTARDHGVAKIGYSNSPKRRATELSTKHFARIKLEAVIPGDRSNEDQLHGKYSKFHKKGEWFNLCDGIEDLITLFKLPEKKKKTKPVEVVKIKRIWPKRDKTPRSKEPNPRTLQLIKDINAFCKVHGMAETTFGYKALGDKPFVSQIKNGRRVWPETEAKVRDFMRDYAHVRT